MSIVKIAEIIAGLGLLIFVHELGHFLVAKFRGIKVEKFSLGFGPRLIGFKRDGTDYFISLIPLGGYVKLAGDDPEQKLSGEKWEFLSQPWWGRLFVYLAGPVMNYVLAIVIIFVILAYGIKEPIFTTKPIIGNVVPMFPAERAGLQSGDYVSKVNGVPVDSWQKMSELVGENSGKTINLTVSRENKTLEINVTPKFNAEVKRGVIGISPFVDRYDVKRLPVLLAFTTSVKQTYNLTALFFVWLKKLIIGEVSLKESVGGPVLISKIAYQQAKSGVLELMNFFAFLTINLAVLNLLPIPVLDGGQILFLIIEGIRKKPLSLKVQLVFQQIGLAILIFLVAFTTLNDIFFRH